MTVSFDELVLNFQKIGLTSGDVLLVHSSYKSFGGIEGGPQTVIDAIRSILTDDGTLIVPTFNYDFCDGKPFNIKKTPSKMGIISELVRINSDSKRTLDPVFSFAILGKYRDYLTDLRSEHSFGPNSIFAKLRELDAKIMIIGLAYNESMTFFHHIEETQGCDYRYFKEFKGSITNYDDVKQDGKIILFVRDIERGVQNAVDKMGSIMEQEEIVKSTIIGKSRVKIMKANDVYKRTVEEMKKNPHILIKIKKE
ncbi:aminoglycoside N3'-acetyltransferase [Candidatus Nitrosarchaeum limnium SFB1]|jgi:aminoglycoside 3-N-acetyltransferase|uniref:Aminoglycoside N3'-acetyltransferase n=1 Tax=Candidatus Nitrosarchaeum limnium SFB1 TaxID=886738 RepID=F3KMX3_9ARCH|nr:aminoglycoside N3'-acetyltransferase [Candidatus Nitrosarchaeum limnium SFB1]